MLTTQSNTALYDNPFMTSLKSISPPPHIGVTFDSAMKIGNMMTDEASLINSEKFIEAIEKCEHELTSGNMPLDMAKDSLKFWNENQKTFQSFFKFLTKQFTGIDNDNAKKLIKNIHKAAKINEYMVDYVSLIVQVGEIKKTIKAKEVYTVEKLEKLFDAK